MAFLWFWRDIMVLLGRTQLCHSLHLLSPLGQNAHKPEQEGAGSLFQLHWRQWGKPANSRDVKGNRKTAQWFTGQRGENPTSKNRKGCESHKKGTEGKVRQDPLLENVSILSLDSWKSQINQKTSRSNLKSHMSNPSNFTSVRALHS